MLREVDRINAASMDSKMTGWQTGGDSLIMESEVAATASGCLDFRTSFTEVEMEEFPTTSLR